MKTPARFKAETKYGEAQDKKANRNLPVMALVGDGGGTAGVANRPAFYWIRLVADDDRLTQCRSLIPLSNGDYVYVKRARDRALSFYEFVAFIQDGTGATTPPVQVHDHHDIPRGGPDLNPETFSPQTFIVGPAPCTYTTLRAAVTAAGAPTAANPATIRVQGIVTAETGNVSIPQYCHVEGVGEGSVIGLGDNRVDFEDYSSALDIVFTSSHATSCLLIGGETDVELRNVKVISTGSGYCFDIGSSTNIALYDCIAEAPAAASHGFHIDGTASAIVMEGCTADTTNLTFALYITNTASVETKFCSFRGTVDVFVNTDATWNSYKDRFDPLNCTISGTVDMMDVSAGDSFAFKVENTSGGAVAAGAPGYIDSAGEFKTTATAYLETEWAVAVIGGPNNANIWVARRGRVTVILNGNCNIGDYLYTSTTAGQAQPQSYVRPELFAVALTANAGGPGGTCEALLYCGRKAINLTSTSEILRQTGVTFSQWSTTIAVLGPGANDITYTVPLAAGNEDSIVPNYAVTPAHLCKLVMHNTTRGDYALIQSVNTVANTVTFTAARPAGWLVGDNVQVDSLTCVTGVANTYFDLEIVSAEIPDLAVGLVLYGGLLDTGAQGYMSIHSYTAYAVSKEQIYSNPGANLADYATFEVPVHQRRFCMKTTGSGAATIAPVYWRLIGCVVADP